MNRIINQNEPLHTAWYVRGRVRGPIGGRSFWSLRNAPLANVSIGTDGSAIVVFECASIQRAASIARMLLTARDIDVESYPGTAYHV